jgi:hypothetical protein
MQWEYAALKLYSTCVTLVIPEFFKEKYLESSPFQFARWEIPDIVLRTIPE